jgi:hypothetical protein
MSSTIHIPVDEGRPTVSDVMMREAESVGPDCRSPTPARSSARARSCCW